MSTKRVLWLAAVLLCAAVAGGPARAESNPSRTVTVSGAGEVAAEPDLARVSLGVEARRPTLEAARSEVAATVDRVLALTKSLGIEPRLVNATRLEVQPEYRWNDKDRQRVLLGYLVSRQVEVEVRNLDRLGPLLERAVDAGVNRVSDPQLDSSHRQELERQALTRAVQDARLNAEALAAAAGARLGAVRTLNATKSTEVPAYRGRAGVMAAEAAPSAAGAPYQTADLKFSASVSAEYDLIVLP